MSAARPGLVVWGGALLALVGLLLRYAESLGRAVGRGRRRRRGPRAERGAVAFVGTSLLYVAALTVTAGVLVAVVPSLDAWWFWTAYALCAVGVAARTLRGA